MELSHRLAFDVCSRVVLTICCCCLLCSSRWSTEKIPEQAGVVFIASLHGLLWHLTFVLFRSLTSISISILLLYISPFSFDFFLIIIILLFRLFLGICLLHLRLVIVLIVLLLVNYLDNSAVIDDRVSHGNTNDVVVIVNAVVVALLSHGYITSIDNDSLRWIWSPSHYGKIDLSLHERLGGLIRYSYWLLGLVSSRCSEWLSLWLYHRLSSVSKH